MSKSITIEAVEAILIEYGYGDSNIMDGVNVDQFDSIEDLINYVLSKTAANVIVPKIPPLSGHTVDNRDALLYCLCCAIRLEEQWVSPECCIAFRVCNNCSLRLKGEQCPTCRTPGVSFGSEALSPEMLRTRCNDAKASGIDTAGFVFFGNCMCGAQLQENGVCSNNECSYRCNVCASLSYNDEGVCCVCDTPNPNFDSL